MTYLRIIIASAICCFALYALSLRRSGLRVSAAAAALPLCAALGLLFAKLGHVILLELEDLFVWGEWEILTEVNPKRLSFVFGAAGVCLGVAWSARLLHLKPAAALDAFAAPGALLVAGARMAEMELGRLGTGALAPASGLFSMFPFAQADTWGDRWVAVFFWEALAAVVIAILAALKKNAVPGRRFRRAVYRLCACQLLLEILRSQSMRWGFVCVEQLCCAVIVIALIAEGCARIPASGIRKYLPVGIGFLAMGGIVAAEFARQKGGSQFLTDFGYCFTAAIVLCLIWLYEFVFRKQK